MEHKNKPNHNNNTIFYENIWIIGIYEDKEIIGRTCIHNGKKMVTIVNENAIPGIILFSSILDVGKITFLDKKKETKIIKNPINKQSLINFINREHLK